MCKNVIDVCIFGEERKMKMLGDEVLKKSGKGFGDMW